MSPGQPTLNGKPLQRDPSVALNAPTVRPIQSGPKHRTQFVVELAGPHSALSSAVSQLVTPAWFSALGEPQVFVMRPMDTEWQVLTPSPDGSFDSVALAWDILSDRGTLTSGAANHLTMKCEQFANVLGRRAMPMPPPMEVDIVAHALLEARDNLDAGLALMVLPRAGVVGEADLWVQCARLGLQFGPQGSFDWMADAHPSPLFGVTPIGQTESFSLAGAQANTLHQGVTIGFRIAHCPDPETAFKGAIHAGTIICGAIQGVLTNDEARPLDQKMIAEIGGQLRLAVQTLTKANLAPGSAAALSLFRD